MTDSPDLAAAATEALSLRLRSWRSDGHLDGVPVSYLVRNGTMRYYHRGEERTFSAEDENLIAARWAPAHHAWLQAIDAIADRLSRGDHLPLTPEALQALADLRSSRILRAWGDRPLPAPRRTDPPALLFQALRTHHYPDMRALLDTVSSLEERQEGWTPLLLAVRLGDAFAVRDLLEAGADPRARLPDGRSVLHLLAEVLGERLLATAQSYFRNGVKVVLSDRREQRALFGRIERNAYDELLPLLGIVTRAAADLADAPNDQGQTPLSHAAAFGVVELVEDLLKRGVRVDSRDLQGRSPLSHAARNGHPTVTRLLLKAGANLETLDQWGYTPLHEAARAGSEKVLELLLKAGADPRRRTLQATEEHPADLSAVDLAGDPDLRRRLEAAARNKRKKPAGISG